MMIEHILYFNNPLTFREIMELDIYPAESFISLVSPKIVVIGSSKPLKECNNRNIRILSGDKIENWKQVFSYLYGAKIIEEGKNIIVSIICRGSDKSFDECLACPKYSVCKHNSDIEDIMAVLNRKNTFYEQIGKKNAYIMTFEKGNAA